MEESLNSMTGEICSHLGVKLDDVRRYSPLALAFIGDDICDVLVRTWVLSRGNCPPSQLHKKASALVNAGAQARMFAAVEASLSEEELSVFRRGKNSKPHTTAKNATQTDYHIATGFECLLGYLYITDHMSRAAEIVAMGLENIK